MTVRAMVDVRAVTLAVVLCATSAWAQQGTVAKLADLTGNVLVSQGDAMVAGNNDQRLAPGTRVVTTAGAAVTINYDVGCDVRLKENERFTVRLGECAVLLKEVVALGPAPGAIGGGVGTAIGGAAGLETIAGVVAVGGLGYGAYETFRKKKKPVSEH